MTASLTVKVTMASRSPPGLLGMATVAENMKMPAGSTVHSGWRMQLLTSRGKGEGEIGGFHVRFPTDRRRKRFVDPSVRQLPVFATATCGVHTSRPMPRAMVFSSRTVVWWRGLELEYRKCFVRREQE